MKKLLIVLILFLFTACGDFQDIIILESDNLQSPYVVRDIDRHDKSRSIYQISTSTDYFNYDDNISIIGLNGEFAIGDTLYLNVSKK